MASFIVCLDLPHLLVESLGVGAEVLANYLTELAEAAATEPDPSGVSVINSARRQKH
jgi:hypothetical protein